MKKNDNKELFKAFEMIIDYYDDALKMEHIHNPLAWALYQVWKVVDGREQR